MSELAVASTLPHSAAIISDVSVNGLRAEAGVALDDFDAEWRVLERNAPNATAFQSRGWSAAWLNGCEQVRVAEHVRLLTVRRGRQIVFLWPLAVRKLGPFRILHALGEPATQYCDALVAPNEDVTRLLRAAWDLILSWRDIDLVELRRVRSDAAIAGLPALAQSITLNETTAPFVDLAIAADGLAHRSSRTRNALRRHGRKLAEHGKVEFELIAGEGNKVRVVNEAVSFKRQQMLQRRRWSNGYWHAVADAFTRSLALQPEYVVSRLTVGGETAAVEAGYVLGSRYWSLTQSYDERFAAHAPGRLLMWHFLSQYCPSAGIRTVDFLAPAHEYKLHWSTGETAVRDHLIPLTFKGSLLSVTLRGGRPALKRVYSALPMPARRYVASMAKFR